MRPFVFLDRDGTLVRDTGYPHRVEDYALLPGVVEGLRRLAAAGYGLAIVTNQSGIGRGLYREEDFHGFQSLLLADLAAAGVVVEAVYHCPHAPDAGCACRKPAPGLLERARRELDADLAASWVVGDAARDVELARAAGCAGAVLILPEGAPPPEGLGEDVLVASNLVEAADCIAAAAPAATHARTAPD